MRALWITVAALLPAAHPQAQNPLQDRLVGWVQADTAIDTLEPGCGAPAARHCAPVGETTHTGGGGTAWDPQSQSIWITDGRELEQRAFCPDPWSCSSSVCQVQCSYAVAPRYAGLGEAISGLAVSNSRRWLLQLETRNFFSQGWGLVIYDLAQGCPSAGNVVTTFNRDVTTPYAFYATGLAYDDTRDLIYIADRVWNIPAQVHQNYIRVYRVNASNQVQFVCEWGPPSFHGPDPVAALAYDPTTDTLCVSYSGNKRVEFLRVLSGGCAFQSLGSCTDNSTRAFQGLAVLYTPPCTGSEATYGTGCAGAQGLYPMLALEGCPRLTERISIELSNALAGAPAFLVLGSGRATTPLLGCTLLVPWPFVSASFVTAGPSGVPGAGTFSLPFTVPNDPSLVGAGLNLQSLVIDADGGQGVAFSNGLEFIFGS